MICREGVPGGCGGLEDDRRQGAAGGVADQAEHLVEAAAQAAIVRSQATRSVKVASAVLDSEGDRAAAADEVRISMTMLLIAGPSLIEAAVPPQFLRQARHLAGALSHALVGMEEAPGEAAGSEARLDAAVEGMRDSSAPLLRALNTDQRTAVEAPEAIPTSPDPS